MRIRLVLLLLIALPIPSAAHAEDLEIKDRDVAALVAALQKSNETLGPHRISLAAGGIYTLQSAASPGLGLPALRGDIVIEGNGAEIRRYAASRMSLARRAALPPLAERGNGFSLGLRPRSHRLGVLPLAAERAEQGRQGHLALRPDLDQCDLVGKVGALGIQEAKVVVDSAAVADL